MISHVQFGVRPPWFLALQTQDLCWLFNVACYDVNTCMLKRLDKARSHSVQSTSRLMLRFKAAQLWGLGDTYMYMVFTLCACTRSKVVGFVCRLVSVVGTKIARSRHLGI